MKLEATDVLPNINCTQTAKMAEKCSFFVPGDLDLQTRRRDQTRLPREFGANPFSGFGDISYTDKNQRLTAPKTEPCAVHCVW